MKRSRFAPEPRFDKQSEQDKDGGPERKYHLQGKCCCCHCAWWLVRKGGGERETYGENQNPEPLPPPAVIYHTYYAPSIEKFEKNLDEKHP